MKWRYCSLSRSTRAQSRHILQALDPGREGEKEAGAVGGYSMVRLGTCGGAWKGGVR